MRGYRFPVTALLRIRLLCLLVVVACAGIGAAGVYGQSPSDGVPVERLYRPKQVHFRGDTVTVTPRWFVPDMLHVQYAGNIGFVSVGAGYKVGGRYEPSLYLGFLNRTFGRSEHTVTTLSLKNSFKITKRPLWDGFTPKAGLSVNWGYTNNTFHKLPPHYDDKYYFQNKIHFAPFAGGQWMFPVRGKAFGHMGVYAELSTLDAYLLEAIRTRYVGFADIWNLAFGVSFFVR